MRKIYTILRTGQPLHPEVMQGVASQEPRCCIVPVTDARGTAEQNRARLWNKVRELCEEEIIIGMDSDVVLESPDTIEQMLRELKAGGCDMATVPTQGKGMGHQVFVVWKYEFPLLRAADGECCVCRAIEGMKVKVLDIDAHEVRRE